MQKLLRADKDAYITNRIVNGVRRVSGSTGAAGTLDLFKISGLTFSGTTPNVELSRALLHFDLASLSSLVSAGKLAIDHPSFQCILELKDVYGGQTTPADFTLDVFPLSRSFDEGLGRDVVQYSDEDVCNFVSSSRSGGAWLGSGCALSGSSATQCDFITGALGISMRASQSFDSGFENMSVDVTTIVSSTLASIIPDAGFRVSFSSSHETDSETYFVKRFASRHAHDKTFHPALRVKFDDSVQDDTQLLTLDDDYTLFLRNYSKNQLANIRSGSSVVTGSNSLLLKLRTVISGGIFELFYTGSQSVLAGQPVVGVYSASVFVSSSNATVRTKLDQSGSLDVVPIWGSLDGSVSYLTGTKLYIEPKLASTVNRGTQRYYITTTGVGSEVFDDETILVRVNIVDPTEQRVRLVKTPAELPGIVLRDAFYAVRDAETNEQIVSFDATRNSTRLSSDAGGMWFELDAANLIVDRRYVIDITTRVDGYALVYSSVSPTFKVRAR